MDTQVVKEINGKRYNRFDQEITGCTICGHATVNTSMGLCDSCWELKSRMSLNPALARKILGVVIAEQRGHK